MEYDQVETAQLQSPTLWHPFCLINSILRFTKDFTELLDKFEQLSLLEQEDVRKKVGWPRRTKLDRVKEHPDWTKKTDQAFKEEPDPSEVDLILRVPEIGSDEKRNELREFLQKRGLEWDDMLEYVFFHFHPEWLDPSAPIPYGENLFVGEVLFDDVITIRVQFDRAKLIEHLKNLSPVARIAKQEEEARRRTLGWLVHGPIAERGENTGDGKSFERVLLISDVVYKQAGENNDNIGFASIKETATFLRDYANQQGWASMEDIDLVDKEFAVLVEYGLCDGMTRALAVAARNFLISVVEADLSEDGQVSAARYKELTQNKINYLRVRGQGGSDADYPWNDDQAKAFGGYYVKYHSFLKNDAKSLLIKYPDNWREMLKPIDMGMPEGFYNYLPSLIKRGGQSASELALQIAACKIDPAYLADAQGKLIDSDKTWPLDTRTLFRRVPNEYKIRQASQNS